MEYPIKTLSQLRLFLRAFRKASGMTQAVMASHLGVTQQTYAQLEANPTSASLARLFKVLCVLNVELTLRRSNNASNSVDSAEELVQPAASGGETAEGLQTTPKIFSGRRLANSGTSKIPSKRNVKSKSGASRKAPNATVVAKRENW